jgi:putative ABC transport system ATP-binding protein
MTSQVIIKVDSVIKNFDIGGQKIEVLKGISLQINRGDFSIIFGPSGCGKSTLLHTILGMERPTSGEVELDGQGLYSMTEDEMVSFRKARIGVVFQQPIWIKSLSVMDNVCVPNRLKGLEQQKSEEISLEKLRIVKLEEMATHHPSELSSGQQQRISWQGL